MRPRVSDPELAPLVEKLYAYGSAVGRQLRAARGLRLRSYLRSLFDVSDLPPPNRWRHLLAEALASELTRRQLRGREAVCRAFLSRPVIQQADHSNLLLDTETFLNNYLFYMAAREAGAPLALNSQCSTVVCFSRRVPPTGPVFLARRGRVYNVFGLSKSTYRRANFCALPGPLTMTLELLDGSRARDPLLASLQGQVFSSGPDAYEACNDHLWRVLHLDGDVRRVQVDERMTAKAIALHVEDASSPLARLLFEPELRDTFLQVKRSVVESPRNIVINRATPDWFWLRRGPRLYPLVLTGRGRAARYVIETTGADIGFTPSPEAIAAAIRRGELVGDRIMSYLVRCLLPGVVAVGGTVQQDYVEAYQMMLRQTHAVHPFLTDTELRTVMHPGLTRLGGAPLVELDDVNRARFADLGPATDLSAFEQRQLDEPIGRTVGNLSCAWFYEHNLRRVDERRAASERTRTGNKP